MEVHCNYCNWIGQEPSTAEFETTEDYDRAYVAFRDSHDNPAVNTCPNSK